MTEKNPHVDLGAKLQVLEDPGHELTLDEVAAMPDGAFEKSDRRVPNHGFTHSAYWARIRVSNPDSYPKRVVVELTYPLIDHFDLYVEISDGWEHRKGGDAQPFGDREIHHRNTAFRVPLAPGEARTAIFRIASSSSMQFPIEVWCEEEFANARMTDQVVYGLLYGLLIGMIIYHLFLFFPTREKGYIYFFIYLVSITWTIASLYGHAVQYLWFWSPWMANHGVPMSIALAITTAAVFARGFVRSRVNLPRFDIVLKVLASVGLALFVASFFDMVQLVTRVATIFCICAALLTVWAGVLAGMAGFRAARFFVLAWVFFCVGVITYSLKSLGVIPTNFFTDLGIGVGTGVEAVLISLALGDRIAVLRRERDQARERQLSEAGWRMGKMKEIREVAGRLAEVSSAMSSHMGQVIRSSGEVVQAVEEAGSSIESIGERASEVETNAAAIASSSAQVSTEWGRGQSAIDRTAAAIVEIERESSSIADMTSRLFEKIAQVDDVIAAVRSVAEQTKVLSVNASIEAAEAGHHGRGFGVIAQEINSLASESDAATRDVSSVLSGIRESLKKIVDAAAQGAERTSRGTEAVRGVQGFVHDLASGMSQNVQQADGIAQSVAQQARGFSGVVGAMNQINRVAQENIDSIDAMERAVGTVDESVENLNELLESWGQEG